MMNANRMIGGELAANLRQEKSLEQKLNMDRLDVDGIEVGESPKNKSLTGHENQFAAHGLDPDVHGNMSHENRDISHG